MTVVAAVTAGGIAWFIVMVAFGSVLIAKARTIVDAVRPQAERVPVLSPVLMPMATVVYVRFVGAGFVALAVLGLALMSGS